jgi:hypothetical protein
MDSGRGFADYGSSDSFHKRLPAYEWLIASVEYLINDLYS